MLFSCFYFFNELGGKLNIFGKRHWVGARGRNFFRYGVFDVVKLWILEVLSTALLLKELLGNWLNGGGSLLYRLFLSNYLHCCSDWELWRCVGIDLQSFGVWRLFVLKASWWWLHLLILFTFWRFKVGYLSMSSLFWIWVFEFFALFLSIRNGNRLSLLGDSGRFISLWFECEVLGWLGICLFWLDGLNFFRA